MNCTSALLIRIFFVAALFSLSVYSAEHKNLDTRRVSSSKVYSIQNDIAFVSVWGSRPAAESLKGFQFAVLYNARGEVVRKIEMGKDSIYSLDKMIQENRSRGPLMVRMYRR